MHLRSKLAIAGTALALIMIGSTSDAKAATCESYAPYSMGQTLMGSALSLGCWSPPVRINSTIRGANNSTYVVTTQVDAGADYLQVGEVVEVEIDVGQVIGMLKDNPAEAMALAVAMGLRGDETKPGIVRAVHTVPGAKLNDVELEQIATFLTVSLQNNGKARGRSDPAAPQTTRTQATIQAITRAIQSFARSIPSFGYSYRRVEYYSNGAKKSEIEQTITIQNKNST